MRSTSALRFLALIFLWPCSVSAQSQADAQTQAIVKVVKYCVSVVNKTVPDEAEMKEVYRKFYKNFDAFYNPATGTVQNNATTVGDQKPLYFFNKCMAEQGFALK